MKTSRLAKLQIALVVLTGTLVASWFGYRLVAPEIAVANVSRKTIEELIVHLPSSRVSFGELPAGTEQSIYYSASQADGAYNYTVRFVDGKALSGMCGYVTNSEFGKRLQLVVMDPENAECRESNKVF